MRWKIKKNIDSMSKKKKYSRAMMGIYPISVDLIRSKMKTLFHSLK